MILYDFLVIILMEETRLILPNLSSDLLFKLYKFRLFEVDNLDWTFLLFNN